MQRRTTHTTEPERILTGLPWGGFCSLSASSYSLLHTYLLSVTNTTALQLIPPWCFKPVTMPL